MSTYWWYRREGHGEECHEKVRNTYKMLIEGEPSIRRVEMFFDRPHDIIGIFYYSFMGKTVMESLNMQGQRAGVTGKHAFRNSPLCTAISGKLMTLFKKTALIHSEYLCEHIYITLSHSSCLPLCPSSLTLFPTSLSHSALHFLLISTCQRCPLLAPFPNCAFAFCIPYTSVPSICI